MNLQKLFEAQQVLDEHIMNEHPVQENESRLAKKILALQVELGECANEWRGFKFWSKDQEPRTAFEEICECPHCDGFCSNNDDHPRNYVLEEYVDCLHFILSIGLEEFTFTEFGETNTLPVRLELTKQFQSIKYRNISTQFLYLFNSIGYLTDSILENEMTMPSEAFGYYVETVRMFVGLGEMLGFTLDQIEAAYFEKNKVNHQRQEEGY
ncbi:dUTP diphosphatase [Lysinibacillus telephonicus]|uniref:dUTP diphosphatase n=1 Tax=Lysinibacillus telephonicus TaxID=1714840 RepID=UPI0031FBF4D3